MDLGILPQTTRTKFNQEGKSESIQLFHEEIFDLTVLIKNITESFYIEAKNKSFFIDVKYHSELLVDEDFIHNEIFKIFIEIYSKKNL